MTLHQIERAHVLRERKYTPAVIAQILGVSTAEVRFALGIERNGNENPDPGVTATNLLRWAFEQREMATYRAVRAVVGCFGVELGYTFDDVDWLINREARRRRSA